MKKSLYFCLLLAVLCSFSVGDHTFGVEEYEEITVYESFNNVEQRALVGSMVEQRVTVPKNLGNVAVDNRGRIYLSSIKEYGFQGIQSLCSLAVKLFLQEVTDLKPYQGVTAEQDRLWKGDAIRLISSGIKEGLLYQIPSDYRGLRKYMTSLRQKNGYQSIFDMYLYTENTNAQYETEEWYNQGHRIVVFLGDDARWYVYDPFVAPYTTKPHTLKSYMKNPLWKNSIPYTLSHGYNAPTYEHHAAKDFSTMHEQVNSTIDTIHENTLGDIEDYVEAIQGLFIIISKPLPPLI